jgi:glycosyltransferase 2 family protein
MSRPAFYKSRWFAILVGVVVMLGCFGLAFWSMMSGGESLGTVFRNIGAAFQQADYRTLFFMAPILALFYYLKAVRWRLLLKPLGDYDSVRDLLPPIMVGFAINNVAPLRLGELARVVVFARKHKVAMSTVLASLLVERILDALTILGLLALGISQLDFVDYSIEQQLRVASVIVGAAVVCGIVYLIWTQPFIRLAAWVLRKAPFVPQRFEAKFLGILEAGNVGLASLRKPNLIGGIVATSLAQWVLNALWIYCALTAFAIREPWPVSLVLMGVVAFGVAAPSVPGFFGVIQFCFLLVLQFFGYDHERIFAASIYFHMAQYIPVTLIGLVCFAKMGIGWGEMWRKVETVVPEGAVEPSN